MSWVNSQLHNLSLYLHIPFCHVRCAYCDFNTYAGLDDLMPTYARALAREVSLVGEATSSSHAHTIFLGGGTPSLLPLPLLAEIFNAIRASFTLTPDCEITLEANPGTVSREYLAGLRALGVNRLSLGVQSSHPHELQLLDRMHLFGDVAQAVTWARAAGFENLNLDLIYALPQQTLAQWQATLQRVMGLGSDHISCYALSLEHGTPMRAWVYRGLLPLPDPDLAAEMYEWTSATLEKEGFEQYEISNWARQVAQGRKQKAGEMLPQPSHLRPLTANLQYACRHNLQYWRNLPYLGFGAGAHGCAHGWRYSNVLAPAAYIERMTNGTPQAFPFSPALAERITVTPEDAMNETMLLGLRLTSEGVSEADFRTRFGVGLHEQYPSTLRHLRDLKLVEWDETGARLTQSGRFVSNRVFEEFV